MKLSRTKYNQPPGLVQLPEGFVLLQNHNGSAETVYSVLSGEEENWCSQFYLSHSHRK